MARGQHQSISEKLNTVETFIIMGQKKEITDVMDGYSYPKAKLQAMEPVLAQAKKLVSVQVTESAERIASRSPTAPTASTWPVYCGIVNET